MDYFAHKRSIEIFVSIFLVGTVFQGFRISNFIFFSVTQIEGKENVRKGMERQKSIQKRGNYNKRINFVGK